LLKVGIDGSVLTGPKTGIGHYTAALAEKMAALEPGSTFYLYANAPVKPTSGSSNLVIRSVPCRAKFYWQQKILPGLLKEDGIELFWGGNYALPLLTGGLKKVVTVHDLVFRKYPGTLPLKRVLHLRMLMPAYLRSADQVLVVSEHTRRELVRYYPGVARKVAVVYPASREIFLSGNGPDESNTAEAAGGSARGKQLLPDEKFSGEPGWFENGYILYVGALEPRKGLDSLIKAYSWYLEETGNAPALVLAGPLGWKAGPVLKLIKETLPANKVVLTGHLEDEALAALYRRAKLFVYPSIYEGFGLPVIEAMAAKVPVITSCGSSLVEAGGKAAVYVTPGDHRELAEAMARVLSEQNLWKEMIEQGLRQARRFSWEKAARKTFQIFSTLV